MTDRTRLQLQAKRVYEALAEAKYDAMRLAALCRDDTEKHFAGRLERDLDRLFHPLQHLMHEDDVD